jgi:hypothetical protein
MRLPRLVLATRHLALPKIQSLPLELPLEHPIYFRPLEIYEILPLFPGAAGARFLS